MSEVKTEAGFWAIVEVMGHKKYAGYVSEQVLGGASFVRVDVPETRGQGEFSKLFSAGSIYCITPVKEDIARGMAGTFRERPVQAYDLPSEWRDKISGRTLPAPAKAEDDYDTADFDEPDYR